MTFDEGWNDAFSLLSETWIPYCLGLIAGVGIIVALGISFMAVMYAAVFIIPRMID